MADRATQQRRSSKLWIWIKLLVAVALAYGIKWVWPMARGRYPWLPGLTAEELLAVLAIAFAVVQFLDARVQERELDEQSDNLGVISGKLKGYSDSLTGITQNLQHQAGDLKDISGSMSTRFVGPFPENMKAIISLLDKANRTIEILVDFPGYGQFSALDSHIAYLEKLIRARQRKVKVQIIGYQLALATKERAEQFPDCPPDQWTQIAASQNFHEYFNFFTDLPRPNDSKMLRQALVRRDVALFDELRGKGVEWKFHQETAAFFLWLVDGAEAIFTFKNVGRKDVGLSFRTRDGNLVRQFKEIFSRRWTNARENYDDAAASQVSAGH